MPRFPSSPLWLSVPPRRCRRDGSGGGWVMDLEVVAAFVNSVEALVEWNSLSIDRYDVRHLLSAPLPPRLKRRPPQPERDLDHLHYLDLPSSFEEEPQVSWKLYGDAIWWRYVLLLMSPFSIYCGLIYNEFFSVPYHIFGASAYKCRDNTCRDEHTTDLVKYRELYPFGVDPNWLGSRSEFPFLNSLKMKMSILFGVVHMNLGIILSYSNAHFFGSSLDISMKVQPMRVVEDQAFGIPSLTNILLGVHDNRAAAASNWSDKGGATD